MKRRFESACASTQSGQSLPGPHEETVHLWLFAMHPVKILTILRKCAGSLNLCRAHIVAGRFSDIAAQTNLYAHVYPTLVACVYKK